MDTNVAGLNKVVCIAPQSSSYNGKCVTISDDINTWSGTIANITGEGYACIFMIPSMPAPAKKRYTVKLYDSADTTGSVTYSRVIDLGFGDSVRIGLYETDELMHKTYATYNKIGGVKVSGTSSNGVYVDMPDGQLKTYKASTSQLGSVMVGNGLQMNSSDTKKLELKEVRRSTTDITRQSAAGTISAGSIGVGNYDIPSVAIPYLKRGFVEYVWSGSNDVAAWIGFVNTSSATCAVWFYNSSSSSFSIPSTLELFYVSFHQS